jgi:hypothetical protein
VLRSTEVSSQACLQACVCRFCALNAVALDTQNGNFMIANQNVLSMGTLKKDVNQRFRMTSETRRKLEELASHEGLTMTGWMEMTITRAYREAKLESGKEGTEPTKRSSAE